MVQLTERAVEKVSEILNTQDPQPAGLRISSAQVVQMNA